MPTNILRNFYYISTVAVDDYVSAIDGAAITEEEQKRSETTGKGASAQLGVGPVAIAGGLKGATESEITRKLVQTYSGKVQKVYAYLEANGLQFFDSMNEDSWKGVRRNVFLELDVEMRFSKIETLIKSFRNLWPLFENLKTSQGDAVLTGDSSNALAMMALFSEADKKTGTPVELNFINGGDYRLVAYLDQSSFLVEPDSMPKEVTLLGKIQRVFASNEKVELINLIPLLEKFSFNREMKRKLKESMKTFPEELRDTVKGPGAVITPIAIYN